MGAGRVVRSRLMEPVSEWIRWRFPAMRSLDPAALEQRLRGERERERLLLLDVRSAAEYEVSHLEGAVRIDPNTSDVGTLVKELGLTDSPGTVVVCSCTVGFHACRLAQRLCDFLAGDSTRSDPGTVDVYNLEGGLLRWSREKRPLVDCRNQLTSRLHPYCQLWEELLEADFKPPA